MNKFLLFTLSIGGLQEEEKLELDVKLEQKKERTMQLKEKVADLTADLDAS